MENISKDVFVFVEQNHGIPADVSFELLTKGRKLADKLGGELKAIVLGYNVEDIAKETFTYGSDECFLVDHPELKYFRTLPYSNALGDLILTYQPRIVLFGATIIGRDIAPRLASKTKSGLTADCTDLQISDVVYLKQDYKDLLGKVQEYEKKDTIRTLTDKGVKSDKYAEMLLERLDKEKDIDEQLTAFKEEYADMFNVEQQEEPKPQFGAQPKGTMPSGKEAQTFGDFWSFMPKEK